MNAKDIIITDSDDLHVREYVRETLFADEVIDKLFRKMKRKVIAMVMATREEKFIGIATMEDIIEDVWINTKKEYLIKLI